MHHSRSGATGPHRATQASPEARLKIRGTGKAPASALGMRTSWGLRLPSERKTARRLADLLVTLRPRAHLLLLFLLVAHLLKELFMGQLGLL